MPERRWWLVLAFVLAPGLCAGGMAFLFRAMPLKAEGNLGDAASAVGAIFSALAFAGVIVAIVLQSDELRLQRAELSMTRDELAGQKAQLESQNRTMSRDLFESCFFQLLRLNRECVNSHTALFPDGHEHAIGMQAFRQAAAHLVEGAGYEFSPALADDALSDLLATEFARYCLAPTSDFGHYFRNLYHVFAFIDRSELKAGEKSQYAKIVRAQLSTAELIVLFANAQTSAGRPFAKFIRRYALFKGAQWPQQWQNAYSHLFPSDAYEDQQVSA